MLGRLKAALLLAFPNLLTFLTEIVVCVYVRARAYARMCVRVGE